MQHIAEGEHVAYVGDGEPDAPLSVGDEGIVLMAVNGGSHVQWQSGECSGGVSLVANSTLVVMHGVHEETGQSPIVAIAARDIYDEWGPTGLFNTLVMEGQLDFFSGVARKALEMIASRIRNDDHLKPVLSQLGPEEGNALVTLATATLLRDAFGA